MSHFPPPPELPPKVGLFRRVPPAIFPPMLGLLGLVSAWDKAALVFGLPRGLIDVSIGVISALFLFCIGSYAAKFWFRRGTLPEDTRTLPGRTGIAALCIALMIEAALLVPFSRALAALCLLLGSLGLLALALAVLRARLLGVDPSGPPTPAMHLVFVGFIVAPAASLALGAPPALVTWVVAYCILAAAIVTVLTVGPLLTGSAPPPLRPLQAIHLAPWAFIAMATAATGWTVVTPIALSIASVLALFLLVRARWLTEGPFSGFWSAFTFPVTAFASALLSGYVSLGGEPLRIAGGVVLVATTLYIPVIAVKVFKLWADGTLAAKTNAAIA